MFLELDWLGSTLFLQNKKRTLQENIAEHGGIKLKLQLDLLKTTEYVCLK